MKKEHTYTLGIEEEFAIVDPETRELRSHIQEILEGGKVLLLEQNFSALENFLNVRPQLARLRIDNRELLFDAESISVFLLHSAGRKTSADFKDLHRLFQN